MYLFVGTCRYLQVPLSQSVKQGELGEIGVGGGLQRNISFYAARVRIMKLPKEKSAAAAREAKRSSRSFRAIF